jgi:hypothetical protein
MKLLFDLSSTQFLNKFSAHGGGEYAKSIFNYFVKRKKNLEINVLLEKGKNVDEEMDIIINEKNIKRIYYKKKKEIEKIINIGHFNTFYSPLPYYLHGLFFESTRFVFTIHGLRNIEKPYDIYEKYFLNTYKGKMKYYYKKLFNKKYYNMRLKEIESLLNVSKKFLIVVPSQHTKYSLLNLFPKLEERNIKMLYSPPAMNQGEDEENEKSFEKEYSLYENEYYLMVSGNRWIKNGYRGIIALDELVSKNLIDKKIVVLGMNDFKVKINNSDSFLFLGYVKRNVLEWFLKRCYALIYPTLNEGFGYPPLECMKYRKPVIASAVSSIPEICQNGVLYTNPYDILEIQNRVLQLERDSIIYEKIASKGYEVYKSVYNSQINMIEELNNEISK